MTRMSVPRPHLYPLRISFRMLTLFYFEDINGWLPRKWEPLEAPNKLRFKLILTGSDVALMIGRNGFTASAIRSMMKAAGEKVGVQVSLLIHSHEEEAQMAAKGEA